MRYLLFVPAALMLLLPVLNAAHAFYVAARRQHELDAAKTAREEAQAAARAQREAEKAAREAEAAAQPRRKRGRPRKQPQETPVEQCPEIIPAPAPVTEAAPVPVPAPAAEAAPAPSPVSLPEPDPQPAPPARTAPVAFRGNNTFAGQMVAFTGTLPGMTRREAISAVVANGGRATEDMPVGTTLLVVGDKPGMRKMDKADEWIGQVKKITAAQFADMLRAPLTLELDEAAAFIRAQLDRDNTCEEA